MILWKAEEKPEMIGQLLKSKYSVVIHARDDAASPYDCVLGVIPAGDYVIFLESGKAYAKVISRFGTGWVLIHYFFNEV